MGSIIFRKKRNTYYYRYDEYIDSKRKQRSINLETADLSEAKRLKEIYDDSLDQGQSPRDFINSNLADYSAKLKAQKAYHNLSTTTLEMYGLILNRLLDYDIAYKPIRKLKSKEIENFLRWLNVSKSYTDKWKNTIKQLIDLAIEDNVVHHNVAVNVKVNWVKEQKRKRFFTQDELVKIFQEADRLDKLAKTDKGKIYRLFYYSGMRRSEIVFFDKKYYDQKRGLLLYPADAIKSRRDTYKFLHTEAINIIDYFIEKYPDYDMPILNKRSPKWYNSSLTTHFRRLLARLGIKNASLHTFRHTYLTYLAGTDGTSPFDLQNLAGHADPRTTSRYSHPMYERLKEATQKLPVIEPVEIETNTSSEDS